MPEPIIVYKDDIPSRKEGENKYPFCFKNGKPRLQKRTPGGNIHHELDD